MKGTENIIAHIKADAQAKADAITAEAEKQCADIREEYNNKAKGVYVDVITRGEKAGADLVESRERIIGMEAKKEILAMKQELVAKAFDTAEKRILSMPKEEYLKFLTGLIAKSAVTGTEEIVLNQADAASLGKELIKMANAQVEGAKFKLSKKTGDFAGGLIMKRGNIEANCTVELLIELCKAELSADVAKVLFS
jgi:Archaeal/vacuolar-type H+-ATPase subunit E